jgi:hypothetical protein
MRLLIPAYKKKREARNNFLTVFAALQPPTSQIDCRGAIQSYLPCHNLPGLVQIS